MQTCIWTLWTTEVCMHTCIKTLWTSEVCLITGIQYFSKPLPEKLVLELVLRVENSNI